MLHFLFDVDAGPSIREHVAVRLVQEPEHEADHDAFL